MIKISLESPVYGTQEARIYPEGGVSYHTGMAFHGWVLEEDNVNPELEELVDAARAFLLRGKA